MTERHADRVIWADDDGCGLLRPLESFLLSRYSVTTVVSFSDAKQQIDAAVASSISFSLLADIILPISEGRGALDPYLGIALAEYAVQAGARRVIFLTVIPLQEIAADVARLRAQFPAAAFIYYHKADLLEPQTIEQLLHALSGA